MAVMLSALFPACGQQVHISHKQGKNEPLRDFFSPSCNCCGIGLRDTVPHLLTVPLLPSPFPAPNGPRSSSSPATSTTPLPPILAPAVLGLRGRVAGVPSYTIALGGGRFSCSALPAVGAVGGRTCRWEATRLRERRRRGWCCWGGAVEGREGDGWCELCWRCVGVELFDGFVEGELFCAGGLSTDCLGVGEGGGDFLMSDFRSEEMEGMIRSIDGGNEGVWACSERLVVEEWEWLACTEWRERESEGVHPNDDPNSLPRHAQQQADCYFTSRHPPAPINACNISLLAELGPPKVSSLCVQHPLDDLSSLARCGDGSQDRYRCMAAAAAGAGGRCRASGAGDSCVIKEGCSMGYCWHSVDLGRRGGSKGQGAIGGEKKLGPGYRVPSAAGPCSEAVTELDPHGFLSLRLTTLLHALLAFISRWICSTPL
ncbi:hypothetical protein CALVIDRAFT_286685 [Calocera viscosa TUFC12733]|uniref:Uncharacterized protein n=1 Tax=Calocera viscosa (strain TUFC12733) TaxID=1330018 RepID=A0A167IV89_CALVF|nr:hypothetical protein CALVIDRAFT_286685 [Calocera viscosa TUFC12733]